MVVQPTKGFSVTMIAGNVGSVFERPTGCLDNKRKKGPRSLYALSLLSVLSLDDETALECPKGLSKSRRDLSLSRRSNFRSNDSYPDVNS